MSETTLEPQNIYHAFYQAFGRAPKDETFHDLPVVSPCGWDCLRAITAAQALLEVTDASGLPAVREAIIGAVESTIEVFWRG